MPRTLTEVFAQARQENRSALIGYMPAGFPSVKGSIELVNALADAGVDIVEVGFPYSDPVMDGPVIQQASQRALDNGFTASQLFDVIEKSKAS
ncbi:MAG: tryptophan synthase subunit alpha, partial [Actinobacteria bacterium]|nr:tryptophan synthase subunit alpha [Actinomycetota bacterium]